MPGCRKINAASPPTIPPRRVELRRFVRRGTRAPRAANDNRRAGSRRSFYWLLLAGAMPTLGLLAALSTFL